MNPLHTALAPKPALDTSRKPVEPAARLDRDTHSKDQERFGDILRQQEQRAAERKRTAERAQPSAEAPRNSAKANQAETPASPDVRNDAANAPHTGTAMDSSKSSGAAEPSGDDAGRDIERAFGEAEAATPPPPKPAPDAPALSLLNARLSREAMGGQTAAVPAASPAAMTAQASALNGPGGAQGAAQIANLAQASAAQQMQGSAANAAPAATPADPLVSVASFSTRRTEGAALQSAVQTTAASQGAATGAQATAAFGADTSLQNTAKPVDGAARGQSNLPPSTSAASTAASATSAVAGTTLQSAPLPKADPAEPKFNRRDTAMRAADEAARTARPAPQTAAAAQVQTASAAPLQVQMPAAAPSKTDAAAEVEWLSEAEFTFDTRHDARSSPAALARLDATLARPEIPRHIAEQMASAAQRLSDRKPIEIALNPEELGRVRMSLSAAEGGMVVTVLAERGETLDLMRRHIAQLAEQFRDIGYDDVSFSFGTQSGGAGDGSGASGAHQDAEQSGSGSGLGAPASAPADTPDPSAAAQITLAPTEGLDLRL
ncbi:MAG: flagellar hook-length control protein FliK [Paracoccaceae bacterium]